MKLERDLIPLYIFSMLFGAIICWLFTSEGFLNFSRWAVCSGFLLGAALNVIGFYRYMPEGPTINALLVLLFGNKVLFTLLGIAFFILALGSPQTTPSSLYLVLTYSIFGAVSSALLFQGAYILLGAGRGWISTDVYKNPFSGGSTPSGTSGKDNKKNDQ